MSEQPKSEPVADYQQVVREALSRDDVTVADLKVIIEQDILVMQSAAESLQKLQTERDDLAKELGLWDLRAKQLLQLFGVQPPDFKPEEAKQHLPPMVWGTVNGAKAALAMLRERQEGWQRLFARVTRFSNDFVNRAHPGFMTMKDILTVAGELSKPPQQLLKPGTPAKA